MIDKIFETRERMQEVIRENDEDKVVDELTAEESLDKKIEYHCGVKL